MVRQMECIRCGRELTANLGSGGRASEGRQVICEACGQVDEPSEQALGWRSPVNELLETALADLPPPPRPPAARQFPWLIVAGAALGLAAFVGAMALVVSRLREESALTLRIADENDESPRPSPARKPELPEWRPDLKIERQLGVRVGFGRWSWRIPRGFEPASAPTPSDMKIFDGDFESWSWADVAAEDTMLAAFHLDSGEMKRLNDPGKALAANDRLEAALVSRLTRALAKSYDLIEFDFMPGDSGRLARRKFQRIDFNGKSADSKPVYGVLLFSREGRSLLALVATSPLPPGDERRAELVASLLTLKVN